MPIGQQSRLDFALNTRLGTARTGGFLAETPAEQMEGGLGKNPPATAIH